MYVCMYVRMSVCMCTNTHTHTHARTHTHTHTHTGKTLSRAEQVEVAKLKQKANKAESKGDLVVAAQYQKDIARILGVQYRPPSPACTYTRPRLVHARHCPWELYQLCKLVTKLTCTRVLACVRVHAHQQRASGRVRGATSAAPLRHCVRACECEVQMRKELVDPRRKAAQRRRPS